MRDAPKFVYFIRPVGMDGPIKIGCSDDPARRLATFSPWAPFPLELIGVVPGGGKDENFLHRAFADVHSHREWFRSSPKLRAVIKVILGANSVDAAREFLKPIRTIRKSARIVRTPEHQKFLDLQTAVTEAQRALRKQNEHGAWREPADVLKIVRCWNSQTYRGGGFQPTAADLARVEEYLADPAKHSVIPEWKKLHIVKAQPAAKPERAA